MQSPAGTYNGMIRVNQYKVTPADCPNTPANATSTKPVSLQYTFTPALPVVTIAAATGLGPFIATLNGTVNPSQDATTYHFEYGTTTGYGSVTAWTPAGSGASAVSVSASITGLTGSTTYHCRLVATNSVGTAMTDDLTFDTISAWVQKTLSTDVVFDSCVSGDGQTMVVAAITADLATVTLWLSTDRGATWGVATTYSSTFGTFDWGSYVTGTLCCSYDGTYIGLVDGRTVHRSSDHGTTWGTYSFGTSIHYNYFGMAMSSDGALWITGTNYDNVGPDGAIWVSTDYGATWTHLGTALGSVRDWGGFFVKADGSWSGGLATTAIVGSSDSWATAGYYSTSLYPNVNQDVGTPIVVKDDLSVAIIDCNVSGNYGLVDMATGILTNKALPTPSGELSSIVLARTAGIVLGVNAAGIVLSSDWGTNFTPETTSFGLYAIRVSDDNNTRVAIDQAQGSIWIYAP